MDKASIVSVLEEIGVLLELKGENPFKVRAYQNGARALESMDDALSDVIEEDRLGSVKGIGKALVDKITTLHQTDNLAYYDDLKASVAPGLVEMLEIPNFGPKKIKKVHEALGIDSVDALRSAAEAGKIAELAGFGKKSEEKLLSDIANREAYAQRHLWWNVRSIALPIVDGLRKLPDVDRAEIAGSYRRGKETVGDLDFIVASSKPGLVMEWFTSRAEVLEVSAKGETKSSVRFEGGLQADLRVVPLDRFPFALHHFTGSKEHNVMMRQRALERGWSMSEWGLFDANDDAAHTAGGEGRILAVDTVKTEGDLFKALDLHVIPPELREGRDEISFAENAPIPERLQVTDLRGVFHNHTNASDGSATLLEMAEAAAAKGWEYLGIADHSKASFQANGLDEKRLLKQVETIRSLNESGTAPLHLFAGSEVDILRDGSLDFSKEILDQLDYLVISVHASMTGMSENEMTDRIIRAMATPTKTRKMLGHLTGRILLRREPYAVNVSAIIEAAVEYGVVIEINANPSRLDMDWRHWKTATEAGVLTSINPDAHAPEHFDFTEAGVIIARKGWVEAKHVLNSRSLEGVKSFFQGGDS
jgi:DNA polymerase (family 10)|tara:strand:+ start:175 stop:1947 length:1773 start_codon:yes stop_codon:yes gene_type:complete